VRACCGAPREEETVGLLGALREFSIDQEIVGPTDLGPVFVKSGNRHHIRQVDIVDKIHGFLPEEFKFRDPMGRQVFGTGHAADHQALNVRVLAAEDGVQAGGASLLPERQKIMMDGEEVYLGREFVSRMSPIAVGEDTELPTVDKLLQTCLSGFEIVDPAPASGSDLGGEIGGLLGVGLERADDIHPVQRVQVVEMNEVVVQELCAQQQVTDDAGIVGDGDPYSGVTGSYRSQPMNIGTNTAGPLREQIGIARVTALQQDLNAAEQRGAAPGITDLPVGDFHFYAQMTLDAGNRVDDYSLSHSQFSLVVKAGMQFFTSKETVFTLDRNGLAR